MDFGRIIADFSTARLVPKDAIRAALADPDAFVKGAVALLKRVEAGTASKAEEKAVLILVHVLGEIGDRRALAPLLDFCTTPGPMVDHVLGDAITESLDHIFMSLLSGGIEPGERADLERLMLDPKVDQYVRDGLFKAWTFCVLRGFIPRDEAHQLLAAYPTTVAPPQRDFGWSSYADAVVDLGFADLAARLEALLPKRAQFRSMMDAPGTIAEDIPDMAARAAALRWNERDEYQPFTDTISVLSKWYGFSEEYWRKRDAGELEEDEFDPDELDFEDDGFGSSAGRSPFAYIARNPYKDVGRNDPCPCGSGKKFKKCCIAEAA